MLCRYRWNSRAAGGNGTFLQKDNVKFHKILLLWNNSKCVSVLIFKMSIAGFWKLISDSFPFSHQIPLYSKNLRSLRKDVGPNLQKARIHVTVVI